MILRQYYVSVIVTGCSMKFKFNDTRALTC